MKIFGTAVMSALVVLGSTHTVAETAADKLLGRVIDKQVPAMVYESKNQPWPGGTYAIRIFRNGQPSYMSDTRDLSVSLPLRAEMEGNVAVLSSPLICRANFNSTARVAVTPDFGAAKMRTKSVITLPIPKVMADCGSIQFPVEAFLEQLVLQNKLQWELDIDKAFNQELEKLGL